MNIQRLFKPYIVKRDRGQCQVLIPLIELDDLCERIERHLMGLPPVDSRGGKPEKIHSEQEP